MSDPLAVSSISPQVETVLRFLESVGRRNEAEFYVQLFRAEPKEQFGAICVDANVARHAFEAVILHLRFLADLGLAPVVFFGAFDLAESQTHAARLVRNLNKQAMVAAVLHPGEAEAMALEAIALCRAGTIAVMAFTASDGANLDERFAKLGQVLGRLASRKLISLHRPGGLRQGGALLPMVNLSTEVPSLLASKELTRKERAIVLQSQRLVQQAKHRFAVTVTSPLNLLRELFTVKGAGTLLRKGAPVVRYDSYEGVDLDRVRELIVSSFGRQPVEDFFSRPILRLYLEEHYRGCLILTESPFGPYLTKFATEREARGEGIARDLWDTFREDFPTVFWRARASNPINEWYTRLADGLHKTPDWWVFWKGLELDVLPAAVHWALARPVDLPMPG